MFERPHNKAQRISRLLETFEGEDVKLASELDSNGETKATEVELDDQGQILMPYMQGQTPRELPSLSATAEGW